MEDNRVKILLVDDRPENLFALEVILSDENYICVKAKSGKEALKILNREQDFVIILMDVQMPKMDGFETVQLIRQIANLKHLPIIFLTASMDNAVHIFKGYQYGAVDYMIKPLSPEILKAKVAVFVELFKKTNQLLVQNEEKVKRETELIIANKELIFQNEEKEKRAAELIIANKELLAFTYVSSHDLQEPLRKIQTFATLILENENLSDNGKHNFQRILLSAGRMRQLIEDLLAFSRINTAKRKFEKIDLNIIIDEVKTDLKDIIDEKHATIEVAEICPANIIAFQFRQLMYNLLSNALKFSQPDIPPHIIIKTRNVRGSKLNNEKLSPEKDYCHITIKDNGIGFEPRFNERIFEVFQKLHRQEVYAGTGIGLAIVKKIVENHNGIIIATSELKKGATFDIYIPADL